MLLKSLFLLGLTACPAIVTAISDDIRKQYTPDKLTLNEDGSQYHCAAPGVSCIHVEGDFHAYSVNSFAGAEAMCTKQFEEASTGKFAGPVAFSDKCKVGMGQFVIECALTNGDSYVSVEFKYHDVSFNAVGSATAELRSRKYKQVTGYVKNARLQHGGVDIFVRCPQSP